MSEPRGAGKAGGLLFTVVLIVLGFLAIKTLVGTIKLIVTAVIILFVLSLVARVILKR